MTKRKHRDDIVDGSDDSDEVAELEVSMEDMLNKDHAGQGSPSTTNDATTTAIAATAPAVAPAAANITADGAADGAT
jgi:hypothetical protein